MIQHRCILCTNRLAHVKFKIKIKIVTNGQKESVTGVVTFCIGGWGGGVYTAKNQTRDPYKSLVVFCVITSNCELKSCIMEI